MSGKPSILVAILNCDPQGTWFGSTIILDQMSFLKVKKNVSPSRKDFQWICKEDRDTEIFYLTVFYVGL